MLNTFLGKLIHKDQVGFLSFVGRKGQIAQAMQLIHLAKSRSIPAMLLSLDIRKAFDTVSWDYMFFALAMSL